MPIDILEQKMCAWCGEVFFAPRPNSVCEDCLRKKNVTFSVSVSRGNMSETFNYFQMGWDENTTEREKEKDLMLWTANYVNAWIEEE